LARAVVKNLFPFVAEELKGNFELEDALRFGTLPAIYQKGEKAFENVSRVI